MISVSLEGYQEKPHHIPSIEYRKKDLGLEDIAKAISEGHSISANFTDDFDSIITQKNRTMDNFKNICFVMFDLDDDFPMSLADLNEVLEIKPTLAYTTYSHNQKGKGNRYRLLYIFEELITSIELYRALYDSIAMANGLNPNDRCGRNCVQNVFGTNPMIEGYTFINNKITFHINQFIDESAITKYYRERGGSIMESDCTFEKKSKRDYLITNESFIEDFKKMDIPSLVAKYVGKYPNLEETPMEEVDEDTAYILYPQDYACIQRRWVQFEVLNENGDVRTVTTAIRRIRNGERRRRRLFINGLLRRFITKDNITYDNLLFCLLFEFENFYEHIDIGKNEIKKIADDVWNADLAKAESLRGARHKFRINPKFCEKYGLSKKQAMPIALKQLNSLKIGELYDCSLTDKENVEIFKKEGVDISIRTLKQWRKDNGLNKYKKKE